MIDLLDLKVRNIDNKLIPFFKHNVYVFKNAVKISKYTVINSDSGFSFVASTLLIDDKYIMSFFFFSNNMYNHVRNWIEREYRFYNTEFCFLIGEKQC